MSSALLDIEDDSADDHNNGTIEVADCGGTYTGHLGSGESKYWNFTISVPDVVTFSNCYSDHDTTMYLENSAGTNIQMESTNYCWGDECYDPDYCTSLGTETFTMDPLFPGTYTLKLGWYWSSTSGDYEVNVLCESGMYCLPSPLISFDRTTDDVCFVSSRCQIWITIRRRTRAPAIKCCVQM